MNDNRRCSSWWVAVVAIVALLSAACGSDESGGGDSAGGGAESGDTGDAGQDDGASGNSGGSITDAPPSGEATVSVDGLELEFELAGALACTITDESLTYSYRIGDNEITLGGGMNRADDGWIGSISLTIANPDDEPGPIAYYLAPGENGISDGSFFTVDGSSVKYEGPMLKQPANDGSQPPPVDVGTGVIIASC